MVKVAILMATGCEEIEALTVVDLLRRAKISIDMISVDSAPTVTGAHGIIVEADVPMRDADWSKYEALILPGGMPGTLNLKNNETVTTQVKQFYNAGKLVAAICAAPTVLGHCGILEGKRATCYPGCEDGLTGAVLATDNVVRDGNIITSRGMGTAIDFGLALIANLLGQPTADELAKSIVYRA